MDVALEGGARVVQRPFTNYGDQWNWALDRLPISTPWVLKLDADERVSPELKREIEKALSANPRENAFTLPIRLWFLGKPLSHRLRLTRLWRAGKARFSSVIVNEHLVVEGGHGEPARVHRACRLPRPAPVVRQAEPLHHHGGDHAVARRRACHAAASLRQRTGEADVPQATVLPRTFALPGALPLPSLRLRGLVRWAGGGGLGARLRTEVYRAIDLKTREIRRTGRLPAVPRALRGDFDPRILGSPLQQLVTQPPHAEVGPS